MTRLGPPPILGPRAETPAAGPSAPAISAFSACAAEVTAPALGPDPGRYVAAHTAAAVAHLRRLQPSGEAWSGWRDFTVVDLVREADDQVSVYLKPSDGGSFPGYKPGQYLTLSAVVGDERLERCYSLSDSPKASGYRITVKRAGRMSGHFNDALQIGDTLQVKAPTGQFFLRVQDNTPVVLIGGGVGITPLLSMLNAVKDSGTDREVHFYYAVTKASELMMEDALRVIAREHPNVRVHFVVSKDAHVLAGDDGVGVHSGYVTLDLLKATLPAGHYEFYLCGPPPMMSSLLDAFQKAGIPDSDIHTEAFGISAKPACATSPREALLGANGVDHKVVIAGMGKTINWRPDNRSLLEAVEDAGIRANAGCKMGSCRMCTCKLVTGSVHYPSGTPRNLKAGEVLPCVAVPLSDVTLELETNHG